MLSTLLHRKLKQSSRLAMFENNCFPKKRRTNSVIIEKVKYMLFAIQ